MGNAISTELEKKLIANLERTIELIKIQKEMKLSLYKTIYPNKKETELIALISREILNSKQRAMITQ